MLACGHCFLSAYVVFKLKESLYLINFVDYFTSFAQTGRAVAGKDRRHLEMYCLGSTGKKFSLFYT